MKKLVFCALAVISAIGFTSCRKTETFEKEYTFDVTVPVTATGTGSVENIVVQDMDMDEVMGDFGKKVSYSDVEWVRVKEARVELSNVDDENNTANFSRATVDISRPDGSAKVSGSAELPDEHGNAVNIDNSFGEQDLKPTLDSKQVQYRVQFDARRATTKELTGKLKVKFVFQATFDI